MAGLIIFYTDKVGQQGDLAVRAEFSGRDVYCEPVSRKGYAESQHLHYCLALEDGDEIEINNRLFEWNAVRGGFDRANSKVIAKVQMRHRDMVTDFQDIPENSRVY